MKSDTEKKNNITKTARVTRVQFYKEIIKNKVHSATGAQGKGKGIN